MKYPEVIGEFETIAAVVGGKNLARFGDGELKIVHGSGYVRESANPKLTREMRSILTDPHPGCIVGIPTMDPRGPKYENWTRHIPRFVAAINPELQYYSAFISRPDSAPWINVHEFGQAVQALWAGKRATVVCERKGKIFNAIRYGAAKTKHVECPTHGAYAVIDELEASVCLSDPEFVVLSAGPTATCLANRLARRGIHAIDLGHAGRFLGELLQA